MASTATGVTGSSSSGIDVGAVVDQLMQVERAPERLMQAQQQTVQLQTAVLKDVQTKVASLNTAVDALSDVIGAFSQVSAQSGDSSLYRVSVAEGTLVGNHTVVVEQLATTSTAHSRALSQATDTFTAGKSFDLAVGGAKPITVTFDDKHNSLSTAAEYINSLNAGVVASVVTGGNGAQLALGSKTSGAAGQITITNDSTGLSMQQGLAGQNARVTVDGITVESATNIVSDALPGLTLSLVSADPDRATTLVIARDTDAVSSAVQSYVAAYNNVVQAINAQFAYDPSTKTAGVLAGDATLRNLQQQLLSQATRSVDDAGTISSLAQLGVKMNDDGTLTLDSETLSTALSDNFSDVQAFFQHTKTGFAVQAHTDLDAMTDTIDSPIAVDLQGMDATSRSLGDAIDAFEVRMTERQKQLTDEYTRIDVMMRQFSSMQQQVSAQLASLATK